MPIREAVLRTSTLRIPVEGMGLQGEIEIPPGAAGVVLLAHGSGSGRQSPRNQWLARRLRAAGLGTLLFDLLTREEESIDIYTRQYRYDVPRLALRLQGVTEWLAHQSETRFLKVGYFGSGTGAAAALAAAAVTEWQVQAIVSRGGRADLAGDLALRRVVAPTLLIVGGEDRSVLEMSAIAFAKLRCEKQMRIVPGATHRFEETGALHEVGRLAFEWFDYHLHSKPLS